MDKTLERVSRALGRSAPPDRVPEPPAVDETTARLVQGGANVMGQFIRAATSLAKMSVLETARAGLPQQIMGVLRDRQARRVVTTRIGLPAQIDVAGKLASAGFESDWWSQTTLDAAYEADAGITDVWFAVAETGSLVIRASPEHGRAVSLVPPLHIAIVERGQIVPDLIDAMAKIAGEGAGSATVFITGPSKTSDIEMTLVTGVHGPVEVVVLLVTDSD